MNTAELPVVKQLEAELPDWHDKAPPSAAVGAVSRTTAGFSYFLRGFSSFECIRPPSATMR
jgi:hypothetical protein